MMCDRIKRRRANKAVSVGVVKHDVVSDITVFGSVQQCMHVCLSGMSEPFKGFVNMYR